MRKLFAILLIIGAVFISGCVNNSSPSTATKPGELVHSENYNSNKSGVIIYSVSNFLIANLTAILPTSCHSITLSIQKLDTKIELNYEVYPVPTEGAECVPTGELGGTSDTYGPLEKGSYEVSGSIVYTNNEFDPIKINPVTIKVT